MITEWQIALLRRRAAKKRNPDWYRRDAFTKLNAFFAANKSIRDKLIKCAPIHGKRFGRELFTLLDRHFGAEIPDDDWVDLIKTLAPIIQPGTGRKSDQFWAAVKNDAQALSAARWGQCQPRAMWGITPLNSLREYTEADRRCGYEAESVVFTTYYISKDFDYVLANHQERIFDDAPECFFAFRWIVLAWALLRYDVFNLFNDRGLIEPNGGYGSDRFGIALAEMDLYREAGKVFYTYAYGADHRMRKKTLASGKYNFCMDCPEPGKHCVCDDTAGERILAEIAKRADAMLTTGLAMEQIPGAKNIYSLVADTQKLRPASPPASPSSRRRQPLRVGHFPNHGFFKGTAYLVKAIEDLRKAGVSIDLVQLSGRPQDEIIEEMRKIDVVVDQLISGSFGLTAIEAMALGKPVVCHVRKTTAIAEPAACPIIRADPRTIKAVLQNLTITNKAELRKIGVEGRAYVLRNYSIDVFARRLTDLHLEIEPLPPQLRRELERRRDVLAREPRRDEKHWRRIAFGEPAETRPAAIDRRFSDWRLRAIRNRVLRYALSSQVLKNIVQDLRALPKTLYGLFRDAANSVVKILCALPAFLYRLFRRVAYKVVREALNLIAFPSARILKFLAAHCIKQAKQATTARRRNGQLRTLWGTTPILTLPLLARCDRKLGLHSNSLVFVTYYITRSFDMNFQRLDKIALKMTRIWPPAHAIFRKFIFYRMLLCYDVFHVFYDRGVLLSPSRFGISPEELRLLKSAGKILYTYAYGADVRTRDLTIALGIPNLCQECPEPGRFCICDTSEHASLMKNLEGFATDRIAMGDMTAYVPNCRNMHYWPLDLEQFEATPIKPLTGRSLKVAHAPNHPHFKGTRFLVEAIERLQKEGHAIELVCVQGVPNKEVIKLFTECDLVAEQFVAGFHGYTALEAMALGRPVLCFLRGPDMTIDPDTCPIINTHPHDIYKILKDCLSGEIDLAAIGKRSRRFIEHYYSIDAVAVRLGRLYIDTAGLSQSASKDFETRVNNLESELPPLIQQAPPRPWPAEVAAE